MIVSVFISLFLLAGSLQPVEANASTNVYLINQLIEEQPNPPGSADKVVELPDIDPMYPGGSIAMKKFISTSLNYPREAAEEDIQGLVVYNFVVELDGTLSDFELMHRAHPLLDAEALRIIKSMPPWRPAVYKGNNVRARNYVPMYFKLSKRAGRSTSSTASRRKVMPLNADEEVYTIVDEMPQFVTGEDGLGRFLAEYIKYPDEARKNNVEGRILCSFIVRKDGTVSNIEVVNGLNPELDNEALRVLSMMPKWTPGKNNNENVNVKCILPIDFTLE